MKKAFIFGIPLLALAIGGWSAWQVSRLPPAEDAGWVMMLPGGEPPALHPFLPADEPWRQIQELLHQPLLRLDSQGRVAPALAESWDWHQRLTCWFAGPEALQSAQRRLAELPPSTRQAWELEEVQTEGLALTARFKQPGGIGVDQVLQAVAQDTPAPLTFVRLASQPGLRETVEAFAADPEHAAATVRLWFDSDGTCELVTTRPWLPAREALLAWFRSREQASPQISPFAEVAGLLEPELDFRLGNAGSAVWQDGSPVTAADVAATVRYVRAHRFPVQGLEGFRHIQNIVPLGAHGVRVTYRRSYGAALASWIDFPILPADWIQKQNPADGYSSVPPGAGEWRLQGNADQPLTLVPRETTPGAQGRTLRVVSGAAPLQTRVALATGSVDILWPATGVLDHEPGLDYLPTPPRNRLVILWNVRSSRLSEVPVREALSAGLDRQALAESSGMASVRPAEVLFAPGLWYSPGPSTPAFDLAGASSKLEAAGWIKDVSGVAKKGGQSLEFRLLLATGNPQREALAQALTAQWKKLGALVQVETAAPEALVPDYLARGRFDGVLLGMDYDKSWDLTEFWHSSQVGTGLNFSNLSDPQLDLLLEALVAEFDAGQIPLRARAVQERLLQQQPVLPLLGDLRQMAVRKTRLTEGNALPAGARTTLRSLLQPASAGNLRMRVPNE